MQDLETREIMSSELAVGDERSATDAPKADTSDADDGCHSGHVKGARPKLQLMSKKLNRAAESLRRESVWCPNQVARQGSSSAGRRGWAMGFVKKGRDNLLRSRCWEARPQISLLNRNEKSETGEDPKSGGTSGSKPEEENEVSEEGKEDDEVDDKLSKMNKAKIKKSPNAEEEDEEEKEEANDENEDKGGKVSKRKKSKRSMCEHNRQRNTCKLCGGASICEHNRQRSTCKLCGGSSICEHNRQRNTCKLCGGASICEHNRIWSTCKQCGGLGICEHNPIRSQCKQCRGSKGKEEAVEKKEKSSFVQGSRSGKEGAAGK